MKNTIWQIHLLTRLGKKPSGKTIERMNNNKGYSPSNCKWATYAEQNRNMRSNVWIKYMGKKYIMNDLIKEFNLKPTIFKHWYRYKKLGIRETMLRCRKLKISNRKNSVIISYEGKKYTMSKLAKYLNIKYWLFNYLYRVKKMTIMQILEKIKIDDERDTPIPAPSILGGKYYANNKGDDRKAMEISIAEGIYQRPKK